MATKRRVDPDVKEAILDLADQGWSPTSIEERLSGDERYADRLPHKRTIQRIIADEEPRDTSAPWKLTPTSSASAAFLLSVQADMRMQTRGRVLGFSIETAHWIEAVHRAAPDLDPWRTYRVARAYQARTDQGAATDDLDMWLGFAPWRGNASAVRYAQAAREGWVSPVSFDHFASSVVVAAGSIPDGLIEELRALPHEARGSLLAERLDRMATTADRVLMEQLIGDLVNSGDDRPTIARAEAER